MSKPSPRGPNVHRRHFANKVLLVDADKQNESSCKPHLRGDGEAMTPIGDSNSRMPLANPLPGARWYAAYTAPCREKRVLEHLAMRKIESFLPLYRSLRKWKNGCHVELELPLFPGYVFVRIAGMERVRVLETPSVLSIVSRGRLPEPLQDEAIAILQAKVHLHRAEPHPYLVVGERVSICAGPFSGLSGIILRKKGSLRVVITLDLIMQSVAIEINIDDIEPFHEVVPDGRGSPSRVAEPQS
jgi:transcription antitermination factor NusG